MVILACGCGLLELERSFLSDSLLEAPVAVPSRDDMMKDINGEIGCRRRGEGLMLKGERLDVNWKPGMETRLRYVIYTAKYHD